MIINDIEFPYELIKALQEDQFVAFVGAGVSRNAPTELPDFKGLVETVGRLCGEDYNTADCEYDEFLGDLDRKGTKVHEYVARVLDVDGLQHNSYHENILRLFRTAKTVRVVTTNQDVMLEAAAEACSFDTTPYYSPAIPAGSNFTGIVHLHGVVKEPENIIITDADFGRAYMLNGYATRFLVDMFASYTVLFIGYSYNDPIVRYLTASIPAERMQKAYILIGEGDLRKIRRTGLKIITYPKGEHFKACEAINKLGRYCKRGLFDWENRLKSIDLGAPPFEKELQDEILDGLKKPAVMKRILPLIKSREWAIWLDKEGLFIELFVSRESLNDSSSMLAEWLADNFIDKTLLELIAKHNNNINPAFCSIIVDRFSSEDKNHTENLLRKYVVLFTHIKTEGYLYTLLKTLVERNMLSEAWMVYVDSLDYQIVIKEGFSFKSEGIALDYVPKWLLRDTLINHFWDNTFKKQVIEAEYTVAKLTLMMQRLTNELQTLKGKENDYHLDFLDIEKSVWRDNDDALITICDILRAALFKTSEEDMGSLNEWLRRAFERKESILRRIALLALRDNKKIDASEKVKVVLNKYDLFDLREQEQLFKLLASCFDGASTDLQQTVLDKIWNADLKAEDHYDERTSYYSKYNWYIWLKSQCSSRKEQIEYYLNKIRKIYPDFLPREHPELSSGPVETKWGSESPVSREELYKKSQEDLYCFIKDYHEDNFTTGADRQGLLHMVTDVCSDDFVWALKILRKQIMENDYTTDVWGAVLRGVSRAIKSIEDFIAILDIFEEIECFNLAKDFAGLIEYVLQRSDLKDLLRANETVKAQTFKCLRKLWLQKEERERFKADWPTISLNTTAGIVAHSFVMLACDVKNQQLDVVLKELVADGTLGVTEVPEFICTICEYSAQIYYIDPNWFNEHVIIMLESETLENKVAAWEGLLIGLRTINPALAEVLLPVFTRNRKIRKSLSKDYRNRFIHDYTLIFTYIEDNPIIEHLNPLLDTTEDKILLAKAIKSVLRSMDAKTVSDVWKKWLKQYCQLRLDNIPSAITTDELSEMISWVFIIPETEEIVDVILSIKVEGIIRAELSLFDFGESDIIINHPNEAAKLLVYIYNNCNKAVISKHQIREIANKIISNNVGGDLRERLEEMLA